MISFSMSDFIRAILLLIFLEGAFYLFFPKVIQGFAARCLIDAKPANLRLFGAILIGTGIFLLTFLDWVVQ